MPTAATLDRGRVRPTGAALGADVEGVDLSRPLDGATLAAVEEAWMAHQVLRFRGQDPTEAALTAFSERFGRLDEAPVRAASVREYRNPYVLIVSNIVENGNGFLKLRRPLLARPPEVEGGVLRLPAGGMPPVDRAHLDAATEARLAVEPPSALRGAAA
jgi:alpha-ketoglutarate-dependent taurine dioxygenase